MPTLEDLLVRTLLGGIDPRYRNAHVTDLPVCDPVEDSQTDRHRVMLPLPEGTRSVPAHPLTSYDALSVHFPLMQHVSPRTTFQNIDDGNWRRILTATNGFAYDRSERLQNGRTQPLGTAVAHLCRSEAPTGSRYEVFVTNNSIVNNAPAAAAQLRRLNFEFRFDEIRALVNSGLISSDHWRVVPTDHRRLELAPDETEINALVGFIKGPDSPIPEARRAAMETAFREFQNDLPHVGIQEQRGARTEMRWSMIIQGVAGVYTVLLSLGKAGPINYGVSFLPRLIGTPLIEGALNLVNWACGREVNWRWTLGFVRGVMNSHRYRGLSAVLGVGTNITEQARLGEFRPVADATTPALAQMIENTIRSRYNTMSVLAEGPPGWGKEQLMRTLALRNPNIVFIQVTPNGLMGGTQYRGQLEQRLRDIPQEIIQARKQGRQVVICIDEFHEALSAGKSQESSTSLLESWKGELARGDLRIIGFSTPKELLKARYIAGFYNDRASRDRLTPEFREEIARFEREGVRQNLELRALLNRFQPAVLTPRPVTDIASILRDSIAARREGAGFTITMDDPAIDRISEMSMSPVASEGHIPRSALAIFNGVIDANTPSGASGVTVTAGMVDAYVRGNFPDIAQRFLGQAAPSASPEVPADSLRPSLLSVPVDHALNEAAFAEIDPELARFYRAEIANASRPGGTVSELLERVRSVSPDAAQRAIRSSAEGSPENAAERAVFELVTQFAEARLGRNVIDPSERSARRSAFETHVAGNSSSRPRAEAAERNARTEREERRSVEDRLGAGRR